ncbi:DNA alkylation repair protein [Chitinibacter bivalviorum]|uniref:DNA alkylation repair protein n=1 Tax=Chitinibacter bivalviorum TaxID=2739434 RepID=A0A7H9BLY6_9NEIS|nr:DNA alkylation repair protein [Chitinibacter bivalviorum]QLG89469.1 DNA alkylation repair protein [Chitinibacter bivalviorum]
MQDQFCLSRFVARWLGTYQNTLASAADPIRAIGMAAYMKNQFIFMGIPTPTRRKLLASFEFKIKQDSSADEILALAHALYQLAEREYHYSALDLLVRCQSKLSAEHLPALEALITTHSWWNTVDLLASKVVGQLVQTDRTLVTRMDELVSHPNLWLRRTAILYQLGWKTDTDQARLFHACLANAAETDFFIRKAIGWALRQYARVEPAAVADFVTQHRAQLSALSQREALKHLAN